MRLRRNNFVLQFSTLIENSTIKGGTFSLHLEINILSISISILCPHLQNALKTVGYSPTSHLTRRTTRHLCCSPGARSSVLELVQTQDLPEMFAPSALAGDRISISCIFQTEETQFKEKYREYNTWFRTTIMHWIHLRGFENLRSLVFCTAKEEMLYIHLVQGEASFPEHCSLSVRLYRPSRAPGLPFSSLQMLEIDHRHRTAPMDWLFLSLVSWKCPHSNLFHSNLGPFYIFEKVDHIQSLCINWH